MAIPRITLTKQMQTKLNGGARRKGWDHLRAGMESFKKTSNGTGGTLIIWDPRPEFLLPALAYLKNEEGFIRRKGTCTHVMMGELAKEITKHLDRLGITPPEEEPDVEEA